MAKKKKRAPGAEPRRATSAPIESAAPVAESPAPPQSTREPTSEPIAVRGESETESKPSPVELARPAQSRLLANAFIAAFLLFMIAMPLRYYLGGRGYDERFSWRMFSTIRMLKCEVAVHDVFASSPGGPPMRPVPLQTEVQVAWVGMLERARGLVVKKLLARRCDVEGVAQALFHLECKSPDGSTLPDVDQHMDCKTRVLADGGGEGSASKREGSASKRESSARAANKGEP